ncbi:MAG TPA: Fic family protein [Bacteroidales bacterium]|nr:Fic family protein [Bacteroidales bacterium]
MNEQLMNLDLKAAYEKAVVYAKEHRGISVEILKKLAGILMRNTGSEYNTSLGSFSSAKGDFRLLNVSAGFEGKSYLNYSKIPAALDDFCQWLNDARKTFTDTLSIYKMSFDAHYKLVTIHPWADGNGRMARMLMNMLQFEAGLIPSIIKKENKAKYIDSLIQTRESGNLEIFSNYMFEEHISNLKERIAKYELSSAEDVPVNVPVNVPVKISSRQAGIIDLIRIDSSVTTDDLARKICVSSKTIKRDIAVLKQQGILLREGSDKKGKWIISVPIGPID